MTAEINVCLYDPSGNIRLATTAVGSTFWLPHRDVEVLSRSTPSEVAVRLRNIDRGPGRLNEFGEKLPDVYVGALPILTCIAGRAEIRYLTVPPPPPFTQHAIDQMWRTVVELPPEVPASIRRQGQWSVSASIRGLRDGLNIPSMPSLISVATHLLRHWPQIETVENIWRPLELPGGRERLVQTLGSSRSRQVKVAEHWVPARTLRQRTSYEPWKNYAVASVAFEVVRRLRNEPGRQVPVKITSPIEEVATVALPPSRSVDPPPSAWPSLFREFFNIGLDVLAELQAQDLGRSVAPLCDLWRLYEGWVAAQLLEKVTTELGVPARGPQLKAPEPGREPTWSASWEPSKTESVELWAHPLFSDKPFPIGGPGGMSVVSVTSDLVPDALIVHRKGLSVAARIFDAKHRGAAAMTAGDAAIAASKYLWGLREKRADTAPHVLSGVVLISSGPPAQMYDRGSAAIRGFCAVPTDRDLIDVLQTSDVLP